QTTTIQLKYGQSANGQPSASQLKNGQSAKDQPTPSQATAPESRLREIRNRLRSIRQFFSAIAGIIRKIYRKLNWLKDAKAFWRSENTRQMVCILKDNVLHLWRKIKPKTIRGDIIFGMEDPAATGQILGIAAVFYACYGKGISITPDFTEKKLEGNLLVKGRFSLATAVGIFFRILFSHSWKRFVRDFNQLKEAF
ncbi:MAG: DUF2953 domain-containing protein, partial [Clostridiaceae bacterium]|nr:DUF2953 domain-containing protein [Clostridiaceae bacterium]